MVAAVGAAAHAGCTPDFDALVGGPGRGGAGTGGDRPSNGGAPASGGTHASAGEGGSPVGGERSDSGGAGAGAGENGGGAGGVDAPQGGAGGDLGASGGASGSGGAPTPPSVGGAGGAGGAGPNECAERFADCNAATHNDGCETFLDSQESCGTTCAGGDACTALTVCNAGECVVAQGVVELSIPFSATGQGQRFAQRFSPMPDLTLKTLTMRLYAPGAETSGIMTIYPTDKDFRGGPGVPVSLAALNQGWIDVVVPMGEATTTFDPLAIYQLTFDIQSGVGPWEPVTKIYIDAIWSSDGVISDTFTASYGQTVSSTMLKVDGSAYQWLDALPVAE